MEQTNKTIEEAIEKAKYRLRIEIAEKCIAKGIPQEIIGEVCGFSTQNMKAISASLSRKNNIFKDIEDRKKDRRKNIENTKKLDKELKKIEQDYISAYKESRQREADILREKAAKEARLALEQMKKYKREQAAKEDAVKHNKIIYPKRKRRKKAPPKDYLNEQQKKISSVGNCYLRGLDVEQAALFSKVSVKEVEEIYKSFKDKNK
ncbi:hypothetical protein [Bernardetia sp.]|uniref:hypothetical protein n=1 Tax=Bernardetia sp. TaxID=1937974 RepID=UPI0025C38B50|nr:hypothetical protein [Bernardetia sp.]